MVLHRSLRASFLMRSQYRYDCGAKPLVTSSQMKSLMSWFWTYSSMMPSASEGLSRFCWNSSTAWRDQHSSRSAPCARAMQSSGLSCVGAPPEQARESHISVRSIVVVPVFGARSPELTATWVVLVPLAGWN